MHPDPDIHMKKIREKKEDPAGTQHLDHWIKENCRKNQIWHSDHQKTTKTAKCEEKTLRSIKTDRETQQKQQQCMKNEIFP